MAAMEDLQDVPNTTERNETGSQIDWMTIRMKLFVAIAGISLAIIARFLYRLKATGQSPTGRDENKEEETLLTQGQRPSGRDGNKEEVTLPTQVDSSVSLPSSTVRHRNVMRISSMDNVDFDGILKKIAKALSKDQEIDDLGVELGIGPSDICRYIQANAQQGRTHMGTLDMLRTWRKRQKASTEKAVLRSALLKAGFVNLVDEYLGSSNPGQQQEKATGPASAAMPAPTSTSRREIKDLEIYKLSRLLPDGKYSMLGGVLEFHFNYVAQILRKRSNDYRAAFEELLQEWKNKGNYMDDLDAALMNADLGELIIKYKV